MCFSKRVLSFYILLANEIASYQCCFLVRSMPGYSTVKWLILCFYWYIAGFGCWYCRLKVARLVKVIVLLECYCTLHDDCIFMISGTCFIFYLITRNLWFSWSVPESWYMYYACSRLLPKPPMSIQRMLNFLQVVLMIWQSWLIFMNQGFYTI